MIHFRGKCWESIEDIAKHYKWNLEYATYKVDTFGKTECEDCSVED